MALAKEVDASLERSVSSGGHENPNAGSFVFRNMNYQPPPPPHHHHHHLHQVSESLINFKCGIPDVNIHKNNESLLSFEPDVLSYHWDYAADDDQHRIMEDPNCFQTASNYCSSITSPAKENNNNNNNNIKTGDGLVCDWLYSEATAAVSSDSIQEAAETHEAATQKRPHMGESTTAVCKKLCKKPKLISAAAKDPQSIAAKNRRERISERLKILQELVPNGSKVDLVTMLEKAISYVKFLQLQVKILATDEFWPVHGGKAPDISQVKEAIDAILSSQRERSSSSNSGK